MIKIFVNSHISNHIIKDYQNCAGWAFLGLLMDGGAKKAPIPKIFHTYYKTMKLSSYTLPEEVLKKYKSLQTSLDFYWHQHFFTGNQQFFYINKYRLRLLFNTWCWILLTFFQIWKVVSISLVAILVRPAKLDTLGLLKIKLFSNKEYAVKISVHDITNNIWSSNTNYTVEKVMWPKFGKSSISMRDVIMTSIS